MELPSLRSSFISPLSQSRPHIPNPKRRLIIISSSSSDDDPHKNRLHLLHLSVTLTVLSPSLPALADKKHRSSKKTAEKSHLTPDELRSWSSNLPTVSTRIPYTDLLSLKRRNSLKHIVKLPSSALKNRPDPVLVVLQDSTVLRTVLPTVERDSKFWEEWDELNLNSVCINAYSPPVTKPQIPAPYLGWAAQGLNLLVKLLKGKPKSKRVLEIEQARKELAEERRSEMARLREDREALNRNLRRQKKAEERRKKLETRKVRYEQSLRQARRNYKDMASKWASLARDQNVATVMGFLIFFVFYRTVVLSYRKQKRDYEDRLKIEKADAEERKRIRELEKEMIGLEGSDDEEDGVEGKEEDENAYLKMAKQFMQSGARVRRAHNKRLPQYMERGNEVKFRDVAGLGNIRLELEEIVKFFTLGEMYRRRGVKIPGGILLCGPPGVGKTLLAKAVAGEAGVNFFSISASQFVEIYVGVGASRVRALYQEARENAPSVVFIDEIDAVGRERGLIKGSGGQERDATLNQLLVCLDGFEGRGNVITIAATNRPDILDPALVRPGRFDRKIFIPKPSLIGRVEILKVHGEKKPMADNVDYAAVASMTEGMVGAELANVIEIAAISMMREGRSEITTDDLLQAVQIEEIGMLDKKDRSEELWKRVALNEAAMAVVAVNFPDTKNIEFVTVAPRAGRELGYVRVKMEEMKFQEGMLSRQSLLDHITVQIAPRAADEIWFGEDQLSTIWAETANNARSAARTFVLGGLSEKNYGLSDFWVANRIKDIDLEALDVLNNCYERAKVILQRNSGLIDALVDQLVQKRSLAKKEFLNLVKEKGNLDPMPQSVIAIRNAKRQQFQEMMMARNQLEKGHLH